MERRQTRIKLFKRPKGYRSLMIRGRQWFYRHGQSAVRIVDSEGKGHMAPLAEATEVLEDNYGDEVQVATPGSVTEYINKID